METVALIPAFNEESTVYTVVKKAQKYVTHIMVVDDGSKDLTGLKALEGGAFLSINPQNMGKGAAIRNGFEKILKLFDAKAVILMDADGQHSPEDIPKLLKPVVNGEADLVCGYRAISTKAGMPIFRVISNRLTSSLLNLMFNVKVKDSQCGFRSINPGAFSRLKLEEDRFNIESEMLIEAKKHGLRIKEVEIMTIYDRKDSKINPVKDALRFLAFLLKRKLPRLSSGF